ncbi:uncharacterized protein PG986_014225 [Apiospora aurea]|uniref:Uncharacterized protein n=1 Tax=Apiospora aurea TaxID=335848 RepID=A0ABR1PSD2_9PEZI
MNISIILLALLGAVQAQHGWQTRTVARYPRDNLPTSTVDAQVPDLTGIPDPPGSWERTLLASLENCLSRNRAQKCEGLDEVVFVERAYKFLAYWKTEDWEHDTNNQTDRDLLLRLIEYQDVQQTLASENENDRCPFPDNTVDLIRSARDRVAAEGILKSANARVLDALDVIYDDVCADTKKAKIPRRVQEMTDIVLRGLNVNAENIPFKSNPNPCICLGHYPCGLVVRHYWDPDISKWVCDCLAEDPKTCQ